MSTLVFLFDLAKDAIPGALLVGGCYLAYVASRRGVPAAVAIVKGWWNSTKNAVSSVKSDVANLEAKLTAEINTVKADVAAVKAKVGM